ncbi:uncharacterized protein LOC144883855 [Branchiostoma floridae x Branchiostoma japonicum]
MPRRQALLLAISLTLSTSLLTARPAANRRQLTQQTAVTFDSTAVPFGPTDVTFDLTTAGPDNSTQLVLHKAETANHGLPKPGWHGDSLSLRMKKQVVHLLIGAGSGLLIAILLIICIICLLSRYCSAPEPVIRTEYSPRRDGRRQNHNGGRALSMPEVLRSEAPDSHGTSPNKLKVTMSCPPIPENV